MKFRRGILGVVPVVVAGFIVAWCGFYLLFGASSIFTLRTLKVQEAELQTHLETLHKQRAEIEDRVVRLRPDSLDWDLVDQEAQLKLGPSSTATKSLKM